MLNIGAVLKSRGLNPLLVYIGFFIRGVDRWKKSSCPRVRAWSDRRRYRQRLRASDHEVFGLFGGIDVFCYLLDEGLTARRASILTSVQSGRPVIVTCPAMPDEFDHHPRLKKLIDSGAILLVPRASNDEKYADAITSALKRPPTRESFNFDGWWEDVAQAVRSRL